VTASDPLFVVTVAALAVALLMAVRQIRRVDGPALRMWLRRLVAADRAERNRPDSGLAILDAQPVRSHRLRRRVSWVTADDTTLQLQHLADDYTTRALADLTHTLEIRP